MVPDRTGSVRGLSRRSFHRIAFTDWGPAVSDLPVLCVHGLTRNGRDFDHLGTALASKGRRVICPDLPGRGQSERLKDSSDYVLPQYCSDMTALIAALGAVEIDWVGTSLGGLIGIVLAALPGNPIRRMVINDIGPYLPWAGLLVRQESWRCPAGERPVRVSRSGRPVASVAWSPATAGAKRTQRLCGVCY